VKHGNRVWVENPFSKREKGIPINGLVWMNNIQEMENEALSKIEAGFDVIKIKVGALDFDEECRLLERIRKKHNAFKITLRLDANGAFDTDTALEQIKELSSFEIHSIEQPIKPGQEELEMVCRQTKIPIALDEELIGFELDKANSFIQKTKPSYLILKPTLLGGLDRADSWVSVAQKNNIGWWSTSALEGNIGLYDIALWASSHQNSLPQGLGTGSLFVENFPAKTKIIKNTLFAV
jgi:L-alanine-DL-glutamate epimerase-like enolase superfamily enzyme